jgi:glucose/mannose-6-phosphate isomerase
MLDDKNYIQNKDPDGALEVAANEYLQAGFRAEVVGNIEKHNINRVIVAGMGGSALSALIAKSWLEDELKVSIEIVRTYDLPAYVDENTLVISSSYSGNTEEAISCLEQAKNAGAISVILASGGKLIEIAQSQQIPYVLVNSGMQPRMTTLSMLSGLMSILAAFGVVGSEKQEEVWAQQDWLEQQTAAWLLDVESKENLAKQLAEESLGKTAVFYGGAKTAPLAYKWKISWNENAKNVAFWNQYPEFNHNEFIGWTSHPVEKPFAVFDLVSSHEHSQILKRFEISDRLLSGKRPKSTVINLPGDSLLQQLLAGCILADFVSIYLAILNGVNPTPVELIEKLKVELA